MAVVLDALAPYVKKMVSDMPKEEVRMLLGVSREINMLKENLVYLQDYVTDAERKRITDVSVRSWVKKLKDAMYKAADILELCQLEAMERQEESLGGRGICSCLSFLEGLMGESVKDTIEPFLFCLQNPFFAHEMGSRIKELNQELESIRDGVTKFKFVKLSPEQRRTAADTTAHAIRRRKTTPGFDESAIVGDKIQKDTEKLVHMLISSHHSSAAAADVKVVSIVGPGGMGKSTLAKKVLASEAIKEEFKTKIWLSVTQQFDKVELLRHAVTQAKKEPAKGKDESFLEDALIEALSANKFLLVMDDVWNERAWKDLEVPIANAARHRPGSRVLLTTRNGDVPLKMGPYHSHSDQVHVSRLDDEDAWSLLKKQLPQRQVGTNGDFDDLRDIGMKIIKKCDGLPLAIKVMGGLLSTRRPNERDWENVLNRNIEWEKDEPQEEEDELNYSVRLGYENLPPQLKPCFLYYSLFPKGSGFIEERVISMWISEGFVQQDGKSESGQLDLEEIGAEYHRELVTRNLLEPDDSTGNIWDYTMHDIVRSFAQTMAREEAFVVHQDQADTKCLLAENQKFRRLSIETDSELEWTVLENQETLRTLLIRCEIKPGGSLANFTSLRVLDISFGESDWLVDSLCQLRHLRYLSFSNTNISSLPADIHKMWFLQHIRLDNCKNLDKIPDSITKLVRLRCIFLDGSKVDIVPRGFGGLINLRSLYGFPAKMDGDWCTLEELGALSHLRSLQIQSLENVRDSSIAKKAMLNNKKHLEYLELNCNTDDEDDDGDKEDEEEEEGRQIELEGVGKEEQQIDPDQQQVIESVFDELCPPPILDTLIISRYIGRRLPNWMHSSGETTFRSLRFINLVRITYCTRLPDGLCRIPGLEELQIEHAPGIKKVGPDFHTLARGDGGIATIPFPELKRLGLQGLSGWMEWDWEEEQSEIIAMPALENLELIDCKLTHLPPGLATVHRYNLRYIFLVNLKRLEYLENFGSVVELCVDNCPMLKRISSFSKLRTVYIDDCPMLKVVEGVLVLDSMVLDGEPWEITGTPARCTPKGYQAGPLRQLPDGLSITR